jgi:hypothetical protein
MRLQSIQVRNRPMQRFQFATEIVSLPQAGEIVQHTERHCALRDDLQIALHHPRNQQSHKSLAGIVPMRPVKFLHARETSINSCGCPKCEN